MIGGMRSGALHGGALTATGLSSIFPSVVALQMPGLVDTWDQLDKVRKDARGSFDAAFDQAGFKILGWGDVGIGHVMFRDPLNDPDHPEKGYKKPEIRTPADLKAYNTFYISGDAIGSKFLETLGISSPRALSVPADPSRHLRSRRRRRSTSSRRPRSPPSSCSGRRTSRTSSTCRSASASARSS